MLLEMCGILRVDLQEHDHDVGSNRDHRHHLQNMRPYSHAALTPALAAFALAQQFDQVHAQLEEIHQPEDQQGDRQRDPEREHERQNENDFKLLIVQRVQVLLDQVLVEDVLGPGVLHALVCRSLLEPHWKERHADFNQVEDQKEQDVDDDLVGQLTFAGLLEHFLPKLTLHGDLHATVTQLVLLDECDLKEVVKHVELVEYKVFQSHRVLLRSQVVLVFLLHLKFAQDPIYQLEHLDRRWNRNAPQCGTVGLALLGRPVLLFNQEVHQLSHGHEH